ncbi:hypothetical protein WG922_03365 [Ramlibacter sp. AN1015]|uniref:hypothetical protein n=1 Tax=Ramlibacter sp. AN1015 TaxID=3133428 RepID=UPI0030BF8157
MRRPGFSSSTTAFPPSPELAPPKEAEDVLARYGASKWEMADGTSGGDEAVGPAQIGEPLRSVPDTGGRRKSMDMLNWVDTRQPRGARVLPPVMRRVNGFACSDHSARNTWGFWCRRPASQPGVLPLAPVRVPYHLHDPHFIVVALSVPGSGHSGVVFQASKAQGEHAAEMALSNNRPQARWIDTEGQRVVLTSAVTLAPDRPVVVAMCARPGLQLLRVDGVEVAQAHADFAPSNFAQLLIGWGFRSYFPNEGFGGHVYAVATGKGAPDESELSVLEHYLGSKAGLTF